MSELPTTNLYYQAFCARLSHAVKAKAESWQADIRVELDQKIVAPSVTAGAARLPPGVGGCHGGERAAAA